MREKMDQGENESRQETQNRDALQNIEHWQQDPLCTFHSYHRVTIANSKEKGDSVGNHTTSQTEQGVDGQVTHLQMNFWDWGRCTAPFASYGDDCVDRRSQKAQYRQVNPPEGSQPLAPLSVDHYADRLSHSLGESGFFWKVSTGRKDASIDRDQ